jgi:kinesin family protein C1
MILLLFWILQAAMDSLAREKEARLTVEKSQASLSEELGKIQGELQNANQRVI